MLIFWRNFWVLISSLGIELFWFCYCCNIFCCSCCMTLFPQLWDKTQKSQARKQKDKRTAKTKIQVKTRIQGKIPQYFATSESVITSTLMGKWIGIRKLNIESRLNCDWIEIDSILNQSRIKIEAKLNRNRLYIESRLNRNWLCIESRLNRDR